MSSRSIRAGAAAFVLGLCLAGPETVGVAFADSAEGGASVASNAAVGPKNTAARSRQGVRPGVADKSRRAPKIDPAAAVRAERPTTRQSRSPTPESAAGVVPATVVPTTIAQTPATAGIEQPVAQSAVNDGPAVPSAAASPAAGASSVARASQTTLRGLTCGNCASAAAVVPAQQISATVRQVLDSVDNWAASLPASPFTDLLGGGWALLRRNNLAGTATPEPPKITVHNDTGQTIWIYNLPTSGNYSIPSDFTPVKVENGATAPVTLALGSGAKGKPRNRIYIVEGAEGFTLPVTAISGVDAFNPTATSAGNSFKNYNFLEYNYYPAGGSYQYTFDTSYIDEWSLPIQLQFHLNGAKWSGAVDQKIYGFNDYDTVVNQLKAAGSPYSDLVWSGSTPYPPQPPATVSRIIGPDKVWTQQSNEAAANVNMNKTGWVPSSYQNFVQYGSYTNRATKKVVYPFAQNGTKYSAVGNFNFWKYNVSGPGKTPYPMALRTAAIHDGFPADKNGAYGFFTYPNDEKAGQFTNIPQTVSLDVYVHGTGDGLSDSLTPGGQWLYTASAKCGSGPATISGTSATDTFFMDALFRRKGQAPLVNATGEEGDIVVIVPPAGARSHTVDVVDTAQFTWGANHTSQYVYERSTGHLYFDRNPSLPGYTAVLANLSPSSIEPEKAIYVL